MKRVLLTGASGFIGRHAIAPLAASGYEIHALTSHEPSETTGVRWHRADLMDENTMARVIAQVRPTHLLHFAWYAEPGKYWHSAMNFRWLEASLAMLRHFRAEGGRRVVMAGTCAEYDWTGAGVCSESETALRPATPYGVCKNALQETMRSYCEVEGLSGAWGRVFFVYGPGEHPSRLLPSVVTSLLEGGEVRCTHGNQVRDYLHVEDVASAFVALLDSAVEGPVNIASGRPVSLRELVLTAADCFEGRDRVLFGVLPAPENEPPVLVADVRRLSGEVGWRPRYDLAGGIAQSVQHWREQRAAA